MRTKGEQRSLVFGLVVLAVLLSWSGMAAAKTVFVDQNVSSQVHDGTTWETAFPAVQGGIDAAVEGDEVWVARGTYLERITFRNGIALYGGFVAGMASRAERNFIANSTILDAFGKMGPVILIQNCGLTSTRIDGFTIQNGSGLPQPISGGGIVCDLASAPTIENNTIRNNRAPSDFGGGINVRDMASRPTIRNNVITGNVAYHGGGISIYSHGTIENNTITSNSATDKGGGLFCGPMFYSPRVSGNTIAGNTAKQGGGIYASQNFVEIVRNRITGNTVSGDGGGICIYYDGPSRVDGNVVLGNSAVGRGGGIYLSSGTFQPPTALWNNIIAENQADLQGGGIYTSSRSELVNNTIADNTAPTGGGIYVYYNGPTLRNNIIAFSANGGIVASSLYGTPIVSDFNLFFANTDSQGNPFHFDANVTPSQNDLVGVDPLMIVDDTVASYHLKKTSPCVNTGGNWYYSNYFDVDGEARVKQNVIDRGADELDDVPPSTTILLEGTPINSWYSALQVSFAVSQNGLGDTGLDQTLYSLDAGANWTPYTAPFTVESEGRTDILYYSADKAGNEEAVRTETVWVDRLPPLTTPVLSGRLGENNWYTSDVTVSLGAADGSGSGVASTLYSYDNVRWNAYSAPLVVPETTTLFFYSTDFAGITEQTRSLTIFVDKTAPTIIATDPVNKGINVPVGKTVVVTFGEPIRQGASFAGITLAKGKTAILATVSVLGNTVLVDPTNNLSARTTYTVTIPAGAVKDLAGNSLATMMKFTFTTQK